MKIMSLNGEWLYRIGNGAQSQITVPFSRLPVGRSECVRFFDISEKFDRVFLKFDGITYYAKVFLNGTEMGEMLPYCEYEFEITDIAKPQGNELKVILEDIDRAFGPSNGWENYGGIIRDVSLILRNQYYIKDVFFKSKLLHNFKSASIEVEVNADCPADAQFEISLLCDDKVVCSYRQAAGEVSAVTVNDIRLWSPDSPQLYTLEVRLLRGEVIDDAYECEVGFKDLSCDRHRFILNGRPLFLKGVCKHEMVADSGHCPSVSQMEADMQMIKDMGCNFVRLVHYPHNKKIIEIADRIGLMVSEEPGLWWSDTSIDEVREGAKEVLRRTILRDRNHVSVAFWLCFNECIFTERYLAESAAVCRQYDPTRMVSGANCMSDTETLHHYNKCGFDFYTMHPYAPTFERARKSIEMLYDKPLVFTEWGGNYLRDNPWLMTSFLENMKDNYMRNLDGSALAGAFFWYFAEVNEFNRGEPGCRDGVLCEGLVDPNRNPTKIYDAFCTGMKMFDRQFWLERAETFEDLSVYQCLKPIGETSCTELRETIERLMRDTSRIDVRNKKFVQGPILCAQTPLRDVPDIVRPKETLVFAGVGKAKKVSVIGLTSVANGYPLGGAYGETVCHMSIVYKNGHRQVVELKNGIHITTVFGLMGSSRIDPIAEQSHRFAMFGYDKNFERYVINRLDIDTEFDEEIQSVEFTLENEQYLPLVYGVLQKNN